MERNPYHSRMPAQGEQFRMALGAGDGPPGTLAQAEAGILAAFEAVYDVTEVFGEADAIRLFAEYFLLFDRARTGRFWDLPG